MSGRPAIGNDLLRAMFEGTPLTVETIAKITARSEARLRKLAEREGWGEVRKAGSRKALERRLLVLSDRLVGELEAIGAEGTGQAGVFDKQRIDALAAMLKMVEKIGEITRGPERAKENQIETDADMAAALAHIDARVYELALDLAARMGAQPTDGP